MVVQQQQREMGCSDNGGSPEREGDRLLPLIMDVSSLYTLLPTSILQFPTLGISWRECYILLVTTVSVTSCVGGCHATEVSY